MGQLEDMQVFVRVVEAGGIGRAAEQLGIAKSAVSRRLSELENRLGTRLIHRTTRTSNLTDAGNNYYHQAIKVIDEVAEIHSELQDKECALAGTIRMTAPLSFGLLHFSKAIDAFLKLHPDVSIQIDLSDRHVDLIEDGLDIALRIADLEDSSHQARRIFSARHCLVASHEYLESAGHPTSPNELSDHQLLYYGTDQNVNWALHDTDGTEHRVGGVARMVSNNGDFLLRMANAGYGITLLPTFFAGDCLKNGELTTVLPGFEPPSVDGWFIYPSNRYLPLRVRRLIDFMVERFGDQPYWDH